MLKPRASPPSTTRFRARFCCSRSLALVSLSECWLPTWRRTGNRRALARTRGLDLPWIRLRYLSHLSPFFDRPAAILNSPGAGVRPGRLEELLSPEAGKTAGLRRPVSETSAAIAGALDRVAEAREGVLSVARGRLLDGLGAGLAGLRDCLVDIVAGIRSDPA